ncbi:iron chelate uptake ABC transporter family permease subunit [Agarivorans sp. Z349TD_8]|uniref:iron chelate uptake ABC transporter family permease subunit n=1 Tax=Agarivorans sp. Z349TD_8 TaxID=3421434 RepID=UPI003D7CDA2C
MANSMKVTLLAIAAAIIIAFFLSKGLTLDNYQFFLSRRIPKVLAMMLAAAAIGASSLAFQTITHNRILTPSILGFDSLYVLIQVLILLLFGSASSLMLNSKLNFLIATLSMVVLAMGLFTLYFRRKSNDVFTLLLIGIVCSSLFSSMTNFFTLVVDPSEFSLIQGSMFASFNNVNGELVYWCIAPLLLALSYLYRLSGQLDVLLLGADNAKSLGIDTQRLTMKVMFVVTILVSISTALVGPILFFGLIVVSLTHQLFTTFNHRFLLIACSLLATVLLVGGQWLVENLLSFETTLSVIINFIGGSYFLLLLMRNKFN